MGVLHDFATDEIKEPAFDRPEGAGSAEVAVTQGTRVVLSYHGQRLTAQVEAIERLGSSFVGRVLKYESAEARPIDLAPGDTVRFRPRDVLEAA